jgi:ABC-type Fe3+ transport system substrate-binding protein
MIGNNANLSTAIWIEWQRKNGNLYKNVPCPRQTAEFKSFWDLLNSKWKGKMASLDPTTFGMGAALQFFYYHPELGPAFLRKLYGEMQVTVSRDARQMTDWLVSGKFPLCIRCNAGSEVEKAKEQGLPIGFLDIGKLERRREF